MPDAPLAARLDASPAHMDLAAAIARVEAHLAQHQDDGRAYEVLAPVYLRMGRAGEAADAARAALRLLGETPARRALYGEALVAAANGVVTPEAKQSFEAAAAKDPAAAEPRFFLGLAAEQEGDKAGARDIWGKLAAEAPQGAPWAQALRERLAAWRRGAWDNARWLGGQDRGVTGSRADECHSRHGGGACLAPGAKWAGFLRLASSCSLLYGAPRAGQGARGLDRCKAQSRGGFTRNCAHRGARAGTRSGRLIPR